jgi:hypothetical protein
MIKINIVLFPLQAFYEPRVLRSNSPLSILLNEQRRPIIWNVGIKNQ